MSRKTQHLGAYRGYGPEQRKPLAVDYWLGFRHPPRWLSTDQQALLLAVGLLVGVWLFVRWMAL